MATLLSQRDGPITEDFFRALNGVKNIHKDVKVLLRTNQQTAGYTLDEFGTARRPAVVRGFIDAQTCGGPYVGDMLAWLHQATASEKEHLEALLKQVTVQAKVTSKETRAAIIALHQNGLKCKKIATKNTAPERTIYRIIKNFKERGSTAVKKSSGYPRVYSKRQDCLLLKSQLQNHVTTSAELAQEWQQVLSCILDPLLQLCTISASNLDTADMATYLVNSLYMMKTTMAIFEFTDKRLEMLEFQIEAHLDTLINEQASFVLTRAGLSHIYSCVQQHTTEQVRTDVKTNF
ncbi:hypothetical protein cypCar_00043140 [Cyprinus carpio]|nr:hypothetical protein cypCar_00043140 [Cyprinus carpio]